MKTTPFLTFSLVTLWLGEAVVSAAAFVPGEILLSNYSVSNVQRYSAAGVLEQTYTPSGVSGIHWGGASLTPDGNLVTGWADPVAGIDIFNPAGTLIGVFLADPNVSPADVSVFANGTLALNDGFNASVQLFSQAGTLLSTVSMPGVINPFGNAVGTDNILYVAGLGSNNLGKVSQTGTFLGTIGLGFSPSDLVMSPKDGTLWISSYSNNLVQHVTTTGLVLGSFSSGLTGHLVGIGIAPDGDSLYVTSASSSVIRHFDLNGNQLGNINIASPRSPNFLTVVPAATPEPSTWALLLGGVGLFAGGKRFGRGSSG